MGNKSLKLHPFGAVFMTAISLTMKYLALALLFALVYILPLGHRPLFEPDETRYAEIPREMVASGDWTKLRQAGLRYYEKSPLAYWLSAVSLIAFGLTPLAVRLPAALAAAGVALTLFFLMSRLKDRRRALGTAFIYLTFFEVFGISTFAVLDSVFTFWVTLSMVLFFMSLGKKQLLLRFIWLTMSGVACAGAVLTKGFTGFVIPLLSITAWIFWQRRFKELIFFCLIPLAAAMLVILPLIPALNHSNPEFWSYFFWVEHVQRFLNPVDGQHKQPFWFFLPLFPLGALPWFFFLPTALGQITSKLNTGDSLTHFSLTWLLLPFIFFSACGGKLLTYILPCYAPLAIILADAIFDLTPSLDLKRSAKITSIVLGVSAGATLAVWLPFFCPDDLRTELWSDPKTWVLGAALSLSALGLFLSSESFKIKSNSLKAIILSAFSLIPLFLACFYALPTTIETGKVPSLLLHKVVPLTPPESLVIADASSLAAASWHYQRDDLILFSGQGEFAYGLNFPEGEHRYADTFSDAAVRIKQELATGRPVALIMRTKLYPLMSQALSELKPAQTLTCSKFIWVLYK
ncbi:MAG: hypothetical protein AMR96_03870 [Candidatus Adiutrix intracellularis]|jgi:4-amino-4-deoxy-L-arabinose transferase|nr:MAG: hypothetical protein AMR96_03870 [Candidatus Adiutrix intracellularis]MDR2827742.1 phospholipid carrier-dependent glycosyltransferase [Candidatus Adiutrix intracellularis]